MHKERREHWARNRQRSERSDGFYLSYTDIVDGMEEELRQAVEEIEKLMDKREHGDPVRRGLGLARSAVASMIKD